MAGTVLIRQPICRGGNRALEICGNHLLGQASDDQGPQPQWVCHDRATSVSARIRVAERVDLPLWDVAAVCQICGQIGKLPIGKTRQPPLLPHSQIAGRRHIYIFALNLPHTGQGGGGVSKSAPMQSTASATSGRANIIIAISAVMRENPYHMAMSASGQIADAMIPEGKNHAADLRSMGSFGSGGRDRTYDQLINSQLLYR